MHRVLVAPLAFPSRYAIVPAGHTHCPLASRVCCAPHGGAAMHRVLVAPLALPSRYAIVPGGHGLFDGAGAEGATVV